MKNAVHGLVRTVAGFFALVSLGAFAGEITLAPGDSIQAVVDRVLQMRRRTVLRSDERIYITFTSGDYRVDDTIIIDKDIFGVTWRAAEGACVRFVGSKSLKASAFSKVTDAEFLARLPSDRTADVYVADLSCIFPGEIPEFPDVYHGAPVPPHLYINGHLMRSARWPNADWTGFTKAVVTGAAPKGTNELEAKKWKKDPGVFIYEEPRAARWDFSRGVMLNGYWTHDWDNENRRAVAWEMRGTNRVIRFAAPGTYGTGNGTWGLKRRRFYVFDQLSELDSPGEWYLDRQSKRLYLIPPKGALAPGDTVELAMLTKTMLDCRASDTVFENIEFSCSVGSGVMVSADGVTFNGCRFTGLGDTALQISGDRNHVLDCTFAYLGGAGVRLRGGDRLRLRRADSSVERCTVHDFGIFQRCYAGACVFDGCGITLRGNKFFNAPHLAVRYGGNECLIESNEIHHVVLETNDASAIYTGRKWTTAGNILRGNFIHHLGNPNSTGENGVMALYFDDCDCGDEVTDNVFWKVPRGIMVGGGREHPIRGNVFVECNLGYSIDNRGMRWKNWNLPGSSWHLEGDAEALHYREEPWKSRYPWLARIMQDDPKEPKNDPVESNVFVDCKDICNLPAANADGMKALSNLVMRANLVVSTTGKVKAKLDKRPSVQAGFRMLTGTPENPVDLGFADAANGDFRLKDGARLRWELPSFRSGRLLGYPISAVPMTNVTVTGGFWLPRVETNRRVTVWSNFRKCEDARIPNFAHAAKREKGTFKGIPFDDSDVYKVIEGAAYSLATHSDPKLETYVDKLIATIAAAQEPDGYLYTARTLDFSYPGKGKNAPRTYGMMGPTRWSNCAKSHELYNVGHLYEAAVAYWHATGKRALLDVAIRSADLIDRTFGPREGQLRDVPGHEEIELALVKLYEATGEVRYLKLAKHFVEARGMSVVEQKNLRVFAQSGDLVKSAVMGLPGAYNQNHQPVACQREAVGHAVRAGYLYCAVADLAALTGETQYGAALDVLWQDVVGTKLHLTGGVGARRSGEAFGPAYELPNRTAYLETCAAIANALWNERLFRLTGEAKYIDVLERILFNGFLSGVSLTGDAFFYENPLASIGGYQRSKWFGCSCCPVNVVRFIPQIASFAYATREDAAYVNLFVESEATLPLADGAVKLSQKTDYPWRGESTIVVTPARDGQRMTLNVRIPGWCVGRPVPSGLYAQTVAGTPADFSLKVNGAVCDVAPECGYCAIDREWKVGDVVAVSFAMPVRRIRAADAVEEIRDRLAVERGPIVYCAEGADNANAVLDLVVAPDATFRETSISIGDQSFVALETKGHRRKESVNVKLVPYFAWGHRGAGEMQVWLPTKPAACRDNEPSADERLPVVDISEESGRHVVIAEGTPARYEGHPTTLLADDGKTMFCVWTTGHGGPCGPMARSDDAGLTWRRLDDLLPAVYSRTHRNCPTFQKLKGPDGKTRYFVYSAKVKIGDTGGGLGILMSEDGGDTWQELPHQPQLSAGMPPTGVMTLKDGAIALFGQVFKDQRKAKDRPTDDQAVWMAISRDGGKSYGKSRLVMQAESRNLCEPCCLRSPDGQALVLIARENRHRGRSMMCFSRDEGQTWTEPVNTPWALTGDRHEGITLPDGRYLIAFRDRAIGSATDGQYVAWVGTFDDLVRGRPGEYRIHILKHHGLKGKFPGGLGDTGYSGVELQPDGTIVCTTYSRHFNDARQSSVVSTRFKISETDARVRAMNAAR